MMELTEHEKKEWIKRLNGDIQHYDYKIHKGLLDDMKYYKQMLKDSRKVLKKIMNITPKSESE